MRPATNSRKRLREEEGEETTAKTDYSSQPSRPGVTAPLASRGVNARIAGGKRLATTATTATRHGSSAVSSARSSANSGAVPPSASTSSSLHTRARNNVHSAPGRRPGQQAAGGSGGGGTAHNQRFHTNSSSNSSNNNNSNGSRYDSKNNTTTTTTTATTATTNHQNERCQEQPSAPATPLERTWAYHAAALREDITRTEERLAATRAAAAAAEDAADGMLAAHEARAAAVRAASGREAAAHAQVLAALEAREDACRARESRAKDAVAAADAKTEQLRRQQQETAQATAAAHAEAAEAERRRAAAAAALAAAREQRAAHAAAEARMQDASYGLSGEVREMVLDTARQEERRRAAAVAAMEAEVTRRELFSRCEELKGSIRVYCRVKGTRAAVERRQRRERAEAAEVAAAEEAADAVANSGDSGSEEEDLASAVDSGDVAEEENNVVVLPPNESGENETEETENEDKPHNDDDEEEEKEEESATDKMKNEDGSKNHSSSGNNNNNNNSNNSSPKVSSLVSSARQSTTAATAIGVENAQSGGRRVGANQEGKHRHLKPSPLNSASNTPTMAASGSGWAKSGKHQKKSHTSGDGKLRKKKGGAKGISQCRGDADSASETASVATTTAAGDDNHNNNHNNNNKNNSDDDEEVEDANGTPLYTFPLPQYSSSADGSAAAEPTLSKSSAPSSVAAVSTTGPTAAEEASLHVPRCITIHQSRANATSTGTSRSADTFTFDRVFDSAATQAEVYAEVEPLVLSAVDGYRVCLFAYGQTGSGKTYTMEGAGDVRRDAEGRGITPRALATVFERQAALAKEGWAYELSCYFVEIYNDVIRDLFQNPALYDTPAVAVDRLHYHSVKHDAETGATSITNVAEKPVRNLDEFLKLYAAAARRRRTARTQLNERSSRSHCVFALRIRGVNATIRQRSDGVLCVVDLAGSERVADSGVQGAQLREAININSSLLNLGKCIYALRGGAVVPWRNCRLTHLLQHYLGAKGGKMLMIVNVSDRRANAAESANALRFAQRVSETVVGASVKRVTSF